MERMSTLWVGLGGAIGSIARYHLQLFARRWPGLPWGTLAVNVIGSFALAILVTLALRGRVSETTAVALGTGVLGGFTTYSGFNHETIALAQSGDWTRAILYVLATLVGCLAAGVAGWALVQGAR